MIKKLESILMNVIEPLAQKVNANQSLRAISEGFIRTMPITLGLAIFAIVGSLPIPGFGDWLEAMKMKSSFDAALGASTNVFALYVVFSIAYCFAKNRKQNGTNVGFLALASFILVMPQLVEGKEKNISALSTSFLGAEGIIIALFVALVCSHLYCRLTEKGLSFKMPSSVPPMVSESLGPVFIAMIIFGCMLVVRIGFAYTPYGDIFTAVSQVVAIPFMNIGASVPAILIILFLANLCWFFGVHPNTVQGPARPIIMMVALANIEAFQKQETLPYLVPMIVLVCAAAGGNGNTLGLLVSMFSAKSKRYKSMLKISLIPNLFNINEPLIFGMPLMLEPIFFIPMTFSCVGMGLMSWAVAEFIAFSFNPLMYLLPWTTPVFLKFFMMGGLSLFVLLLAVLAVNTLIYFPFFKIADRKAVEQEKLEEQANLEKNAQ